MDSPDFLSRFSLADLAVTEEFQNTEFLLADITAVLTDISQLIENRLVEKVSAGKINFDRIEENIRATAGGAGKIDRKVGRTEGRI